MSNGSIHWEARFQPAGPPRMLGWNVPPEEIIHIPEHWLSYPEPNPSLHYLLALLYILFTFLALLGNGLVIWVFCAAQSLRTPSNLFVVNLALCDFFMMIKTPIFIYNSFNTGFALGNLGCQIFGFIGSLSGIGASMTNAAIAYDRYSTIARPLDGKLSRGQVILFIVLIWTYTIPWGLMPLMHVFGRFVPEGFLSSCSFDYLTDTNDIRIFVATIFTFSYCIPMSLILYYYSQIVSHVVNHEKALREQAKKMNVESLRSNANASSQSAEIRIAKVLKSFIISLEDNMTNDYQSQRLTSDCDSKGCYYDLLPICRGVDSVRCYGNDRSVRKQGTFNSWCHNDTCVHLQSCCLHRSVCLCYQSSQVQVGVAEAIALARTAGEADI